jgi:hypothetical protein
MVVNSFLYTLCLVSLNGRLNGSRKFSVRSQYRKTGLGFIRTGHIILLALLSGRRGESDWYVSLLLLLLLLLLTLYLVTGLFFLVLLLNQR